MSKEGDDGRAVVSLPAVCWHSHSPKKFHKRLGFRAGATQRGRGCLTKAHTMSALRVALLAACLSVALGESIVSSAKPSIGERPAHVHLFTLFLSSTQQAPPPRSIAVIGHGMSFAPPREYAASGRRAVAASRSARRRRGKPASCLPLTCPVPLVAPSAPGLPSWYSCDPATCTGDCACASTSPPGGLAPEDTPQFIVLTVRSSSLRSSGRWVGTWPVVAASSNCRLGG